MSALLSLNPIPMITWKDKTFNQIHSSLQKNQRSVTNNNRIFFFSTTFANIQKRDSKYR